MKLNIHSVKVGFLVVFAGFLVLAFTFGKGSVTTTKASISGPPSAHTGAPGELNCTDCHNQSSGVGQMSIVAPASYTPGQTYTIQVKHVTTDTTRKRWGFELTSLANNVTAGTFANINATTKIISGSGRSYIEHTSAGTFQNQTGGATWSFNWTAPATNVGNVTMYTAGIQSNNNGSESGDQTYMKTVVIPPGAVTVVRNHVFSDFDGDGKSDVGVFRPSDGNWYVTGSANSQFQVTPFGLATDVMTPADFDGDNKADVAVWRAGAAGVAGFYILQSTTNTVRYEQFGQTGDDPSAVGDWDGDGKADPAVYRDSASGSQSYFYYRGSSNNSSGSTTFLPWGMTGDKPLASDFDGDGKMDAAVFRPSNQVWYIRQSSNGALRADYWGLASDKFVLGDFDGDGKTDLTVFRNGTWYLRRSSDNAVSYISWGLGSDVPVTGDFDSDGKSDVGVYRNGAWYILMSGTSALDVRQFGISTDRAIASVNTH